MWKLWSLVFGVFVHLSFLLSIFDIYFRSPIIHGMTPYSVTLPPPADRLILIVADGLRAEAFYKPGIDGIILAPYLRSVIENKGAWGVAHTRVPTESRPGHSAIIGGIYEDVSAVTRGWKENPVEFDSIFNESLFTWSWGSPDILPMFAKGAHRNHVFTDCYSSSEEDFATSNTSALDLWVFDKFKVFLNNAKLNSSLMEILSKKKTVFFLHLLGLDIAGHGMKPTAEDYSNCIMEVDKGIEEIVKLTESYFNFDGRTAYIFTSDHGMTDWGSHGGGSLHETMVPIVAWGAGIRGPLKSRNLYPDAFSQEWKLEHLQKADINQVDLAPLMATLIGIPIPVNSMGVLPMQYLNVSEEFHSQSLYINALQALEHCRAFKENKEKTAITFSFQPYRFLTEENELKILKEIQHFVKEKKWAEANKELNDLISHALRGLHYYQTYDRLILNIVVIFGYIGWMAYLIIVLLSNYTSISSTSLELQQQPQERKFPITHFLLYITIFILIILFLNFRDATWSYYTYFLLPVIFTTYSDYRYPVIQAAFSYISKHYKPVQIFWNIFIAVFGVELLVLAFFWRSLLSVGVIGLALWPFFSPLWKTNKMLCFQWMLSCFCLAVFPLLPVVGKQSDYRLVSLAGWLSLVLVGLCARRPEIGIVRNSRRWKKEPMAVLIITVIQMVLIYLSFTLVQNTAISIENKEGLPFLNQMASWSILGLSFIMPFFGSSFLLTRILNISASFVSPYILMSTSYEGLFFLCLCITLLLWLMIEYKLSSSVLQIQDIMFVHGLEVKKAASQQMTRSDFRRAYIFILLLYMAFFGTGNIASINSFSPSSVYCFLTVFSPFTMAALLLIKIIIPFILVACAFQAINTILRIPPWSTLFQVLLISDIMALHFFVLVKDYGSWLEIGTTISHYLITIVTLLIVYFLYIVAKFITEVNLRTSEDKIHWQ